MHCHILLIISINIITFNLLIILPKHVTCTINPLYEHHECTRSSGRSYALGSTFEENLNTTLLSANNASLTGFSKHTTGEGRNQVYSVLYCQGNIKGQDCRDCSEAAGRNILQKCPLLKEAIIWYKECTLHYSDDENVIFSTEEVSPSPSHGSYNFSSVLKKLDHEKKIFEKLMNGLIVEAANNDDQGTVQGYATGETPLSSQEMTLGGAVQCRPDLVSQACDTCLRSALKQMDGWSTTMMFLPSCNLRFDLYPLHIGGPSTSSGEGGRSIPKKVLIPVVVVVGVVLLCGIVCLVIFCRRKQQRRNQKPANGELQQAENGEPSNGEILENKEEPPSTRVHRHDVDANMRSTTSHPTAETLYWNVHQNPEPSAPPIPKGLVNLGWTQTDTTTGLSMNRRVRPINLSIKDTGTVIY